MREKTLGPSGTDVASQSERPWLDLAHIAQVEVTSEDLDFPAESAFFFEGPGWRAGAAGPQAIRLIFDPPQRLTRVWLRFIESDIERTQEFTLRWAAEPGGVGQEIVRQQWTFSPAGATTEIEDYRIDLARSVSLLELSINPDLGRNQAVASLAEWRVA